MLLPSCWYGRESSNGLAMIGSGWRAERWSSDDGKAHRTRSDGASRCYRGIVRFKQLLLDVQRDTVIMNLVSKGVVGEKYFVSAVGRVDQTNRLVR